MMNIKNDYFGNTTEFGLDNANGGDTNRIP